MKTIYRIQDAEGRGPFRPGFSHKWCEPREDHDALFPWMIEFGPVHANRAPGYHVGCGCLLIDQLRRWFNKSEVKTLREFGYHAVRMEVDGLLASGESQCVFERAKPLAVDIEVIKVY
jgi:hypothetical protein